MISHTGYRRDSIHKDRPMNLIPSNRISMRKVDHPVIGSDGVTSKMMLPGEEHNFEKPMVAEIPVKGLFALMAQDMMANGVLPGGGKAKALLDDGTAVPVAEKTLTAKQRFDAFLMAHPEVKGTKWEEKGKQIINRAAPDSGIAKGTPLIFNEGGEMNKNNFMNVLSRIASKKMQTGGQVPQEIIDMYLQQQSQDHLGQATTQFRGALDDLLGSAYQTQRDKVRVEDFDPTVMTAQDGAEVPAYIKKNRYRGYVPNFQNPVDLQYEGPTQGLTHPGVIMPVDWGQSTLGSYDVKYRNPIWGKNVKRREHYEFYTPYGKGAGNTTPVARTSPDRMFGNTTQGQMLRTPSTAIDESPFRAQPHVNPGYITPTPYEDDGSIPFMGDIGGGQELPAYREPQSRQPMVVPQYSGYERSSFTPQKPYKPVFGQGQDYISQTNPRVDDYADMSLSEARKRVKKYSYLLNAKSKDRDAQSDMVPGMSIDQTDQLLRRREDEYRKLQQQFKKGGTIEDRLKIASEFYKRGGMKC